MIAWDNHCDEVKTLYRSDLAVTERENERVNHEIKTDDLNKTIVTAAQ